MAERVTPPTDPDPVPTTAPSGRSLWIDPGFGAAGDMVLGALLGLGAPVDDVRAGLDTLGVEGWALDAERVQRCSLSATRALVDAPPGDHHRAWSTIDALLAGAGLPPRVEAGARHTFRRLGEVEAAIHGVGLDEVHFHEVGALDAIVDIVGSWLALDLLAVDEVVVGPVGLGSGTAVAAHGRLPVPAPATADLLVGAPIRPVDIEAETVTPTGAALLATLAHRWGPVPAGRLLATSRGAGGRDPVSHPNVVSALLVERTPAPGGDHRPAPVHHQAAVVLTTNLDDTTPEVIGHVIGAALAAGADDAWATPILMKKSRPGVTLSILCRPERAPALQDLVFAETGTLGLRLVPVDKRILDRHVEEVEVRGLRVRIKVGPHGAKPEHDDLVAVADATGAPLRTLAAEALAARRSPDPRSPERFD